LKNCFLLFLLPAAFCFQELSLADTITLKDNLRGKGIIVKVTSDTLYFLKTGSTHIVGIPRALVKQYEKDTSDADSFLRAAPLPDSVKSTLGENATFFPCKKLEWNNGAEIEPCSSSIVPKGSRAFTLMYKSCNFEISETPTISLVRNTDIQSNPNLYGTGFRAGGFVSAAWGLCFTFLGALLDGSNVKEAKKVEYAGLALLGNAAMLISIGYIRKTAYIRWENRHPSRIPVLIDEEE
jgi:hypothetical protein